MPTKKLISDSVLYRLAGGTPDSGFPVDERDIWQAIDRRLNEMLALRQFSTNLPSGETIPDNLFIATYEDIAVSTVYSGKSKSTLPIVPVSLPRNAGIHEIRPILSKHGEDRSLGNPIIPLLAGQDFLLGGDTLLNDLMGQFGYTPRSNVIYYTKDLTLYDITTVSMQLVVFDISQYSTTQTLPVPSDMIAKLVDELVSEFVSVLPESGRVNVITNEGQLIPGTGKFVPGGAKNNQQ